jgi:hypothetical protein
MIITMEFVEDNLNKPWDWEWLSSNPNMTIDIIESNLNKPWEWNYLSEHIYTKDKELFELRINFQKFVQENLFEEFVKAYMHPKRIIKLLDMGYIIDELDNIL